MSDLRLALRSLLKNPGFSAVVIVTLALGIGANTAIFSLMDAIMLRPLAVRDSGDLWLLYDEGPVSPGDPQGDSGKAEIFSWPLIQQFEAALPTGTSLAAMTSPTRLNVRLGTGSATTQVSSQLVSGDFFSTFAVRPALGRLLNESDVRTIDGHPVAVIGDGFWRRQFGGDPSVIGRTLPINGVPFTIVGVASPEFRGVWADSTIDIWVPLVMQDSLGYRQNSSTSNANVDEPWPSQIRVLWLYAVVRARLDQRDSIVSTLSRLHLDGMRELVGDRTDPESRPYLQRHLEMDASFARGYSYVRLQYSSALPLLMAMVVLVLLVACANVANLLLARWATRQRELAIRMSIGAGRARLVRQLLMESLLLAVIGGAAGLFVAQWASTTLATSARVSSLLPARLVVDTRVLAFCVLVSIATTLIVGLLPALRSTRASANTIRTGGAHARYTVSVMRPLVGAQVALSVILVVAAALCSRSLLNLWALDPGYDRAHLVQIRMDPLVGGVKQGELLAVYQRTAERARQIPGVLAAEVSRVGVASGRRSVGTLRVEGYQPAPGELVRFMFNNVGPTYFATTGMDVIRGRTFTKRDVDGQPQVAVVNETAARRYFGGVDKAVGKRVGFGELGIEVVGVVHDARVMSLRENPTPMAFAPILQIPGYAQALDVRVAGNPAQIGEAVRRAIADAEPRLLATNPVTVVGDALDRGLSRDRLVAGITAAFGAVALILASIGLYGVLTYTVGRRTPEMGVRMALGATPADVLRLIIGDGLRLAMAGIAAGVIGAMAAARLIQSLLFGVAPSDPIIYIGAIATLLSVATFACFLPARRASRLEPLTALRTE
jgi:predicted permease